ncbi:MAG: phosphatase [Calditrichaeota bacterium]|nr:MAG: phosphatase [Calditrichota bacterium]
MINFKTAAPNIEYADLHIHTSASDGDFSPEQVIKLCADLEIKTISITDHDTVSGVMPAAKAGRKVGVSVVPGVELGTNADDLEIHILGYFIDIKSTALNHYLTEINEQRLRRTELIVESLARHGIEINLDKIIDKAGNGTIGRPHIAKAMVEAGVVQSYQAAFNNWIGDGAPACEKKSRQEPAELIEVIHQSGGAAVLAHPGNQWTGESIRQLKRLGLDGIEVVHPRHTKKMEAAYRKLAFECNLFITGGSDFHTLKRKVNPLGKYKIDVTSVKRLKKHCERRIDAKY